MQSTARLQQLKWLPERHGDVALVGAAHDAERERARARGVERVEEVVDRGERSAVRARDQVAALEAGPLVDPDGHLLGLNAVRREGGLILAVPADEAVRARVAGLARGEAAGRPRLGVALAPPRHARRMRRAVGLPERDGLLVHAVVPGSPAERAGLERGDLIVAAGGRTLASVDDLFDALDGAEGAVSLGVVRGSEERDVAVTLD